MDVGVLTVTVVVLGVMTVRAAVRLVSGSATTAALGVSALVVWLLVLLAGGFFEVRHQYVQAAASRVVQEVSGRPDASASCQRWTAAMVDASNNSGAVWWDRPTVATLRQDTCADLASWLLTGSGTPTRDQMVAVHVLTHEAIHVAGEQDEGRAECVAMSRDEAVAVSLGATQQVAHDLAARYRAEVYPTLRAEYQDGCG